MRATRRATLLGGQISVAVAATVACLAIVAALPTSAAETKAFTGQKNCSTAVTTSPPAPEGYCLITQSTFKILMGAKVYYTNATVVGGVLRSPVRLVAIDERQSTVTGQCTYYRPAFFPPGHGLCTYWGGTGKLGGFHATVMVGPPITPGVFALTATYWFDRDQLDD
jgi:hypothetical protein